MCSAFRNKDGRDVIVVINYGDSDEIITVSGVKSGSWSQYRTSDVAEESLAFVGKHRHLKSVTVPKRSITTFISQ